MSFGSICQAIGAGRSAEAVDLLGKGYPFSCAQPTVRKYGPTQSTAVFRRGGFADRYSGSRLVFPPVLRVISTVLPAEFPFQTNWKTSECHPAYWEVGATVDHLIPVTRGGTDAPDNWITTSMARNSAKMNWTIDELGWTLHAPGRLEEWDGVLAWFVGFVRERQDSGGSQTSTHGIGPHRPNRVGLLEQNNDSSLNCWCTHEQP